MRIEPPLERDAGTYPTSSDANDGLAVWTKANRTIANTDIVGWYTLGFHHITRAEDWPVMPTMWQEFAHSPVPLLQEEPGVGSSEEPRWPMRGVSSRLASRN